MKPSVCPECDQETPTEFGDGVHDNPDCDFYDIESQHIPAARLPSVRASDPPREDAQTSWVWTAAWMLLTIIASAALASLIFGYLHDR